jgi:hypothetical protein
MKKRGNAGLDADRFSAYEACGRVEGRAVNRLLFEFAPEERFYVGFGDVS